MGIVGYGPERGIVMNLIDELKAQATPENRKAMAVLEERGFQFLVHFGTKNADARLEAIDWAIEQNCLYEHLAETYGI